MCIHSKTLQLVVLQLVVTWEVGSQVATVWEKKPLRKTTSSTLIIWIIQSFFQVNHSEMWPRKWKSTITLHCANNWSVHKCCPYEIAGIVLCYKEQNHLLEILKTTSGWLSIYEMMPDREEKGVAMIFIIVWPLWTCIILHKGLMKFPNFGIILLMKFDLKFRTLRSLDEAIQWVASLWVEKNSLTIIRCSKKAFDCVCQVQMKILKKSTATSEQVMSYWSMGL